MTEQEKNDLLVRLDERTKKWEDDFKPRLNSHGDRIRTLERDRNVLYGIWVAISALVGKHVTGH